MVVKDKGPSNIQVKIINEEIEEVNQKLNHLKSKLKEEESRHQELENNRERFRRAWANDSNLTEMHLEILNLIMKESIQVVENLTTETRFQKAEIRLKVKDIQLAKLQEQVALRDKLLNEARQLMQDNGKQLDDDKIMTLEQILYNSKYLFEPLSSSNQGGGDKAVRRGFAAGYSN